MYILVQTLKHKLLLGFDIHIVGQLSDCSWVPVIGGSVKWCGAAIACLLIET